jgi:hypothetical protein
MEMTVLGDHNAAIIADKMVTNVIINKPLLGKYVYGRETVIQS